MHSQFSTCGSACATGGRPLSDRLARFHELLHPHQVMLQGPCLKHHISLWARPAAALGNRQTEGPQRQRRSGKSYQNSGYDHNSSSTGSPNNSRGPSRRRQNDPSEYSQQATWQQRRRPSQRGRSASRGYDDDDEEDFDAVDRDFLDPEQAAKLRKLIKSQGRDAVLDKQGFVKETLLQGEDADADQASSSSSSNRSTMTNQRRRPGAASSSPAPTGSRGTSHDANSSQQGRTKLFDPSQLRAAALGSGGAVAALPVVRPSSGAGAGSSSSAAVGAGREAITAAVAARAKRASAPQSAFHSSSSWDDVGASQQVQDALAAIGIDRPSHVQAEAYKALSTKSGFKHVAVADQAGSGKTLAYLLPLLQQLKEREEKHGGPLTRPNSPSIVITTPTTELAQQVGRVVRALSQAGLRVRSAVMTGGQQEEDRRYKSFRTQCDLLEGGLDIVIATPGRLLAHQEKGSLDLSNTAALVLDEVDVLAGGEVDYLEHIAPLRAASPPSMRCILVSATLPQHTFDELQELFLGLGAAFGPGLHRTAPGVVEELIDCSGGDEISLETGTARKVEALLTSLDRHRSPRTIVFCNKIETCRVVENALKRNKSSHQVMVYHEAVREEVRTAALTTWLAPPNAAEPPMVLVCTDRTSRGIDSMWCEHVVLFEFPRDPSEYVRRVGRTARGAGGRGVVSVLVLGKQVPLAKDIMERNRDGAPVHRVPRLWSDK